MRRMGGLEETSQRTYLHKRMAHGRGAPEERLSGGRVRGDRGTFIIVSTITIKLKRKKRIFDKYIK